ncbi:hypothetical protein VNO78_34730 [Psophocarpus tetragonolobus]|uniref:Uncharacterized protein n=1 Tax=Psophocarpus tetragonolobus TaxID=3891 RepID=A0AAN9NSM1_PSOTE
MKSSTCFLGIGNQHCLLWFFTYMIIAFYATENIGMSLILYLMYCLVVLEGAATASQHTVLKCIHYSLGWHA